MSNARNQNDQEGEIIVEHRSGGLFVGFLRLIGVPTDELIFIAGGDREEDTARRLAVSYAEAAKAEHHVHKVTFILPATPADRKEAYERASTHPGV